MRAEDFVNTMQSFVGVTEDPPGSNRTPIGEEYGWNGVAWCAEGVSVACARNGFPLHEAAVFRIRQRAMAGDFGLTWSTTPVVGAIVCFDFGGHDNPADMHTGVVKQPLDGGRFRSIECNHHNRCEEVLRDMKYVMGFAIPPFQDVPAPAQPSTEPASPPATQDRYPLTRIGEIGESVRLIQKIIFSNAGGHISVDGVFGPQTEERVRDVQRAFGLEQDGVVGPQTWSALIRLNAGEPMPALPVPQPGQTPLNVFGTWPHQDKPVLRRGARGDIVRYLQSVISSRAGGGIAVDGDFGPQTERRVVEVQRIFNAAQDGVVGPQTWGIIDHLATS